MSISHLLRALAGAWLATTVVLAFGADASASAPAAWPAAVTPPESELIPADVPPPQVQLADTPDYDALRVADGRRLDYGERCETTIPTPAWVAATQASNFAGAYDIAAKWLATCPVVERVHLWAISSAQAMGDAAKAETHKRWYHGLIQSVLKTGDGKTPETAWKTISVAEEYAVLQALQYQRGAQALVMHPLVDKLTVRPMRGGDETALYFNPELHFARLSHHLGDQK